MDNMPWWPVRCALSALYSPPQGWGEELPPVLQAPCTESEQALAVSSSAFSWQLCSNRHDTCHAHVNSAMRNGMQVEDKLEMRSSLWCQLTDPCKAGSWLQDPHGSRVCVPPPQIPPPAPMATQKDAAKKHTSKQQPAAAHHPLPSSS